MCGIFGLMSYSGKAFGHIQSKIFRRATTSLLKASQKRGGDASGIATLTDKKILLFKTNLKAANFVKTAKYSEILKEIDGKSVFKSMIGHTRARTKGDQKYNVNNHPIVADRIVGVHNGVISNDEMLFSKYEGSIERAGLVDSEIIFRLINYHRKNSKTLVESVQETCKELIGSYACAFIDKEAPSYVVLFSNSSTYSNLNVFVYEQTKTIAFASEKYILNSALEHNYILDPKHSSHALEVKGGGMRINLQNGKIFKFSINGEKNSYNYPMHESWNHGYF